VEQRGDRRRPIEASGAGVRIVPCPLPTRSRWPNPIGPQRAQGKRRAAKPARRPTVAELEERVDAGL
jgi:hypothetical protein